MVHSLQAEFWYSEDMALKQMDNVGIVFEDLAAAIAFFKELRLSLEGEIRIEGDWTDRLNLNRHTTMVSFEGEVAVAARVSRLQVRR